MRREGLTSLRLGDALVHTPPACPRVVKLSGIRMTYPRPISSLAQRSGAPLDRGPSPLQSCMITTAGKGPGPSGFNSVAGICSKAPLGALVVMDIEVAPMQPPRNKNKKQSTRGMTLFSTVLPAKGLT